MLCRPVKQSTESASGAENFWPPTLRSTALPCKDKGHFAVLIQTLATQAIAWYPGFPEVRLEYPCQHTRTMHRENVRDDKRFPIAAMAVSLHVPGSIDTYAYPCLHTSSLQSTHVLFFTTCRHEMRICGFNLHRRRAVSYPLSFLYFYQ